MQTPLRVSLGGAWILFSFTVAFLNAASASSGSSLVVVQYGSAAEPAARRMAERMEAVVIANSLRKAYTAIDMIPGDSFDAAQVLSRIRRRGAAGPVDVIVLRHEKKDLVSGRCEAQESLGADALRDAGLLAGVRMVYQVSCDPEATAQAWKRAGARVAVSHSDEQADVGFFFPRFVRLWGEGKSAVEAARAAQGFAADSAQILAPIRKDGEARIRLLERLGAVTTVVGTDVDRTSRERGLAPGQVEAAPVQPLSHSIMDAQAARSFAHAPFESAAIELGAATLPQIAVDSAKVASPGALVDRTGVLAWAALADSFPGMEGSGGQELWFDGDVVRFIAGSSAGTASFTGSVLNRLLGLRLKRDGSALRISAYFDTEVDLPIHHFGPEKTGQLYEVKLPRAVRLTLTMKDDVLTVDGLKDGFNSPWLGVRIPAFPDGVSLRHLQIHLPTSSLFAEAGVLGDHLSVFASSRLDVADPSIHLNVWETIRRNLGLFKWPDLFFFPH
jgi:hypothetical protein